MPPQGRPRSARNVTDCRGEASTGVREEVECHKGKEKEESEREGKKSELLASLFSSPSSSLSAPRPATGAALMAWHEEPSLFTHGMVARVREHRTAGHYLTRGEGRQSARLFANGTDLEPILIGRNYQLRDTVLRKCSKRGSQKVSNRAGACGACGACDILGRFIRDTLPWKPQAPQAPQAPARFVTFWDPLIDLKRRPVSRS